MAEVRAQHGLPRALLSDPEMINACRKREFGVVFQFLKQAGIYPSAIARSCDMTPSRVGEVIAGKRKIEKIDLVERIADGLFIPGQMLGLAAREWEEPSGQAVMRRSELPEEPHASAGGPRLLIDPEFFATHTRTLMPNHYRTVNLLGSRHALDSVERHLRVIGQLQDRIDGPTRDDLLTLGARIAEFLGWLHQDLGDFTQATYWSDQAMEWSQETGDDVMAAYVLFRKSNQATARRNGQQAVSLARAAQRATGATRTVQALALQQEAQGHALLGNPRFAMAKFDEAHELASAAQTDGESDDAALDTSYCTPVYVEIQRANCLIEMGEPLRAVEALEAELRILPQVYRTDHGVYLSRLARAYATAGEPEQGAEAATHALSIAMDTESARAMAELSAAAKVLATWSAVPAVMAFSTRFNLARGTVAYGVRGGR